MVRLKRNVLSVALASATMLLATGVHAQTVDPDQTTLDQDTTDEATELDRVVVTGIRRGIEDAIDTKQSEDTIVEAISAEDIGKLPDTSIADSIARLPGLTAQRFRGRPQEINIRGFAGDFSTTLLNGREQVSLSNSRGVEFDQYPSELMSAVVVHKTSDAELVAQGLSGTVDLRTVRPLSFDDRVFAVNVRGDMNKINDVKEYGNRYSFSYIDQFADDTIGLALGYAHLNNPGQSTQFGAWGYNEIGSTGQFALGGSDIFTYENDNQRDGFMGTLEWKPNDIYSTVLDVFYSKFDKEENKRGVQFGLDGPVVPTEVSGNNTVTAGSATFRPVLRNDFNAAYDDLFSLGWTNHLKLNENWKLTTDVSYSSGTRDETILETYGVGNGPGPVSYRLNPDGYFDFDFGLDFSDPDNFSLMDPGGWGGDRAQAGYLKYFKIEDSLTAMRFDLERTFDDSMFSSLEMGINYTDRAKSRGSIEYTLCITPQCVVNTPAPLPPDLTSVRSLNFAGVTEFLSMDPRGLVRDVYYLLQKDNKDITNKNWEVKERIGTAYAQLNINTDIGSIPVKGNVGIQAVNAEQSSFGYFSYTGNPIGEPTTEGANYTDFLPSLNLSFQFPWDQFLRFGAARQLARPSLDDMRASNDINFNTTRQPPPPPPGEVYPVVGAYEWNAGNAKLEPTVANSFDLSYEKYFGGNRGYVAAAYFYKDLRTYIYNQTDPFNIADTDYPTALLDPGRNPVGYYRRPVNGEGGTIEGLELSVSIPFDILWKPLEGFGIVANYSDTKSEIHPNGPGTTDVLPGLSKYISNVTLYYERFGFSARASQRTRSKFVGEVQGFGGDRELRSFAGEDVVDIQLGYGFQSGALEGLSFLMQVNNLTDEPARTINNFDDRPASFTEYGRTYLFGVNYKF